MSQGIPIANVYYMLCYAWRYGLERDLKRLSAIQGLTTPQDLLAKLLANGVNHLIRRGIAHGYIERREDLAGIRGRIAMARTIKRALRARRKVACDFEELSVDILANQILRSTLDRLLTLDRNEVHPDHGLADGIRSEVAAARRRLTGVSGIRLNLHAFGRVQLSHDRSTYGFLLSLCRMIYEFSFVDEQTGRTFFRDFRPDPKLMPTLFEAFVTGFYSRESHFDVNADGRSIQWSGRYALTEMDDDRIPRMKADIVLESRDRRIIIDTKFYGRAVRGGYGGRLRSEHLYQLLAYLRNREGTRPRGPKHDGILLYPRVDEHLAIDIQLEGFRIQACTIELNQDWRAIHADLLEILN